jgi:predicted transcriptional regulator YheO
VFGEETKLKKRRYSKEIRLCKTDRAVLHALEPVVEAVARAFGAHCEVVLHSLEDTSHSIIKIENAHVSGRTLGSPLTDRAVEILNKIDTAEQDVVVYYARLYDGRPIKSAGAFIRNTHGDVIGVLCIHIDLSVPLLDFFREFVPMPAESPDVRVEHFPSNVRDLVSRMLEAARLEANKQGAAAPKERTKMTIMELYKRGAFNIKGAVDLVAKETGVSRYTVYNYIREAKLAE